MKSWLEKNGIEMYSAYNEGESVVGERYIRYHKEQNLQACEFSIK